MKRVIFSAFLAIASTLASSQAGELDVLVWNVERGANHFDDGPEKALRVIREANVDLVLMQESYDIDGERPKLGAWLASELKWQADQGESPHLCILTKHKILETYTHEPWHGIGARLATPLGEILAWSCWIDYRSYLPYYHAEHPEATVAELLDCERKHSSREKQTLALIETLRELGHLESNLPLLVGGDWNSPSHLDYGDSTKHLHHNRIIPVPTSIALMKTGMVDTFRNVHPDPIEVPGITWSPLVRTNKETGKPSPLDRIDRLYLKSTALVATQASTLPKKLEDESIPKAKRIFPSDHGAVRITLGDKKPSE